MLETHSGLLSFGENKKKEVFILQNIVSSRAYWQLPNQVLDKEGIFNMDLPLIKFDLQILFFCINFNIFQHQAFFEDNQAFFFPNIME